MACYVLLNPNQDSVKNYHRKQTTPASNLFHKAQVQTGKIKTSLYCVGMCVCIYLVSIHRVIYIFTHYNKLQFFLYLLGSSRRPSQYPFSKSFFRTEKSFCLKKFEQMPAKIKVQKFDAQSSCVETNISPSFNGTQRRCKKLHFVQMNKCISLEEWQILERRLLNRWRPNDETLNVRT